MSNTKVWCVYMHKNKINNKVYIGMTKDIKSRWKCNGIHYKPPKDKENTRPFWNAIIKYGWDNFEHIVLVDNLTETEAIQLEIELIAKYNARNREFGYNVAKGGNGGEVYIEHPRGMLGKTHTEEWCKEHSERMSGENNPFYGKDWEDYGGHPRGFLGRHHTEENKKTMTLKAVECTKKKILAIFPNGEEIIFSSLEETMKELQISSTIAYKLLKSKEPYELSKCVNKNKRERLSKLVGLRLIYFTDNTEVN